MYILRKNKEKFTIEGYAIIKNKPKQNQLDVYFKLPFGENRSDYIGKVINYSFKI